MTLYCLGKGPNAMNTMGKGYTKEQLSMYPGFAGLMQTSNSSPVNDQLALSEALRGQVISVPLLKLTCVCIHYSTLGAYR